MIYLHGFASSPQSAKARAFKTWAGERPIEIPDLRLPSFEGLLFSAMRSRVRSLIESAGGPTTLIGSSLGGLLAARVAAEDPRVERLFLMAPAFRLAERWESRIGVQAFEAWKKTGEIEVDDWAEKRKRKVHFRFVEELQGIDQGFPDVKVPTLIIHGVRDEVVDVNLSREFAKTRPNVELLEVDDDHELGSSIPFILDQATRFLTRP